MLTEDQSRDLFDRLMEPFAQTEVKFKPQSVKGNRCLALAYIDARHVMDRLDNVMLLGNWRDEYTILNDGSVQCRLSLRINGEWVYHEDVGSRSEQPDDGDKMKSAFSDALKRAAVKFGIGRYLYRLGQEWVDYDPQKRKMTPPKLPVWALPYSEQKGRKQTNKPAAGGGREAPATAAAPPKAAPKLPDTGEELHRRLREYDAKLHVDKRCGLGALLAHLSDAGVKAGFGDDITRWSGPAIQFAVDTVKTFEAGLKGPQPVEGQAA